MSYSFLKLMGFGLSWPLFFSQLSSASEGNLVSPDTQVDYQPLQQLLAHQKWREANEKTSQLMLQALNREQQGWVSPAQVLELACWDLKTIDALWREYSEDRFGFSVQFPIFEKTGNRPGRLANIEAYERFGDEVGWRRANGAAINSQQAWIVFQENFNYSLEAPVGHLPNVRQVYNITGNRLLYVTLTQRLVDCQIVEVSTGSPQKTPKILYFMFLVG